MPWNGSGIFTRNYSWVNDAANNIDITASRMDADTNDIVSNGLNNCLTRDGQGSPTANLPMNGFKHTGAAAGVASTDYATMAQIAGFAPLASPAFTGVPTAPTPAQGTSTTQLANTSWVNTYYASLAGATFTGTVTTNGFIGSSVADLVMAANNGRIYMRPAGLNNATNQGYMDAGGSINIAGALQTTGSNLLLGGGGSGVFLRPNGSGNSSGQAYVDTSGNLNISGVVIEGGVSQPTVFVQSGAPTARNVGDLWFF